MCGIAGSIYYSPQNADSRQVEKALELIRHRGPDHQATHCHPFGTFGHTRLSILDLSEAAHQPFSDPSGRYLLTYNGEIYNYRALKQELETTGITFRTSGDTEVLLYWLILKGADGLSELNGFFAFAFLDTETGDAIIARDPMGIKPLYYSLQDNGFLFGSGLNVVARLIPERNIDTNALALYFKFNYIPAPHTLYQEIQKLKPGHYVSIRGGRSTVSAYPLPETPSNLSLRDAMYQSVERRLISDVPIGSFLSGGVDSSIISAIAAELKPGLSTFSVGFKDDGIFDESDYARRVATHIGAKHHDLMISEADLLNSIEDLIQKLDEPFADSSSIAVYALSQAVKQEVTVALSGDGADELFGGYHKHRALLRSLNPSLSDQVATSVVGLVPTSGGRSGRLQNRVRQLKKYREGLKLDPMSRYLKWASFCNDSVVHQLTGASPGITLETTWTGDMNDFLRMDQELVLPNDMLKKVDSMSMAHALEVRTPFLDPHIVQIARRTPAQQKLNTRQGKLILQEVFGDLLPEDIFTRRKHGFEVPLGRWLSGPLKSAVEHELSHQRISETGLLDPEAVERLKRQSFDKHPGDSPYQVWAIFVLQKWLSTHG